jgi:hypothetical protein
MYMFQQHVLIENIKTVINLTYNRDVFMWRPGNLFSKLEFFPIFPNLFSKGIGYRVGLGYRVQGIG